MNRELFERRRRQGWQGFEALLDTLEAGRRPASAALFPGLYRGVCQDLALARSRQYGADLEERLNRLALRGHQLLYGEAPVAREAAVRFALGGFARRVRAQAALFWLCALLLFGPLAGMAAAVVADPDLAYAVLDPGRVAQLEAMYGSAPGERGSAGDFLMFGHYVYNNVGIALRTFAMGILFGVGSVFVLVHNGVTIGAVAGHLHNAGLGGAFYPFVVAHGAFELPAIVLAGMAGMRLGLALLGPGRKSRRQAVREAALGAVPIVYGVVAMLVIAAFVEAFWSSSDGLPAALRYLTGAAAWVAVAGYFSWAGRSHGA
jgi:uncharacterized membrane protein SpoIIM required for sporulation